MVESAQYSILQLLLLALSFGALSLVISWMAWSRGFFRLPLKSYRPPLISRYYVGISFLLFVGIYIVLAPFLLRFLSKSFNLRISSINALSFLQIAVFLLTFLSLCLCGLIINKANFLRIWKDRTFPGNKPIATDMYMGLITWFIAFPAIAVVSELFSALLLYFFEHLGKEQVAIQYLKMAAMSPVSLACAVFSILIGAPVLEEYLFRGVLQTSLRTRFSVKTSIIISSLAFAFFHLTPSQGIANITLFASLFTFALYLGFIYEKQRSLYANIFLHMTFNLISVIRIVSG